MACLEFSDIVKLNVPQVEALDTVARENPDPAVPAACEAFSRPVKLVEGVIVTVYTMAVGLTRRSENLEEIASIWRQPATSAMPR